MPVPVAISSMRQSANLNGRFPITFPTPKKAEDGRTQITRNFHVYLELTMQCKHDPLMIGYCHQINVIARAQDGTQVRHTPGSTAASVLAPGGFYAQRALKAADVTKTIMVAKWGKPQLPGRPVFTPGKREDASVQMDIQSDGYQYEISYWYDGPDIYVLYHVYPSR